MTLDLLFSILVSIKSALIETRGNWELGLDPCLCVYARIVCGVWHFDHVSCDVFQTLACVKRPSTMRRRPTHSVVLWSTWRQRSSTGRDTSTVLTGGHLGYWWWGSLSGCFLVSKWFTTSEIVTQIILYLFYMDSWVLWEHCDSFYSLFQFEMLTGSLPFQGKDRKETMNLILKWVPSGV